MYIFVAVKKRVVKILAFLLLLAFFSETTSGIWFKDTGSVVLTEKDEKGNKKEIDTEKEDSKDKLYQFISQQEEFNNTCSYFELRCFHFKYSAYLSLPEIPPKQV